MKFDLKLFVLVGIFVGLCDVWGTEENEDDGFIVEGLENDELNTAIVERRVIKAVYKTEKAGDVSIIQETFRDQLSSIVVWYGKNGVIVQDFKTMNTAVWPKIAYNMQPNVKYTVYFIFKQGSVNSTDGMFRGCLQLISADFTHFNTENVTDMSCMFSKCSALTKLNLSNFDTKEVTDMSWMFFECSAFTELDLSKFDTQNVTDMSYMFYDCTALSKLNLSNFDTKNVTDMSSMFAGCTALKELNLSNFVFTNGCKMENIFLLCNFDSLCLPNTRKRCWCCGDRYVDLKGNVVVKVNQNNVVFVGGVAG